MCNDNEMACCKAGYFFATAPITIGAKARRCTMFFATKTQRHKDSQSFFLEMALRLTNDC